MGVKDWPAQVEAFEKALQPAIYQAAWRYSCWLSSNRTDAEDLLQESLVRALKGFPGLKQKDRFKGWLLKIVRNTHLMQLRSKASGIAAQTGRLEQEGSLVDLSTMDNAHPASAALATALALLPLQQRELIALYYFEELSLKETARLLGITVNATLGRLHRARRTLKRLVSEGNDPKLARLSIEG
jgi:RNA polymerase sigma-70 factor (ECF subfamily)